VIAASVLSGLCLLVWRRWHRAPSDGPVYSLPSPAIAPLLQARERLDQILKQVWRGRLPDETIAAYAGQLTSESLGQHDPLLKAAIWYNQYATLRFAKSTDEPDIADITDQAKTLAGELRRRDNVTDSSGFPTAIDD